MSAPKRSTTGLFTLLPDDAVQLDAAAFDNLVHNQGVRMVHHRAVKCPIGLRDEHDVRRSHDDHSGCSNGFIYKPVGNVTVVFTSNSTDPRKLEQGFYDGSTVAVTFPRYYDSNPDKRILVRPFDRFYLDESSYSEDKKLETITSAIWDVTHRRNDGLADRCEFPIVRIHHLIDAEGQEWHEPSYSIGPQGAIVWAEGAGPKLGTVYSVWYEYKPFWYCDRLVHEIRVTPVPDYMDGKVVRMERLAFGAILQREYVYRNQQNDDKSPSNRGRKQRPTDQNDPEEDFGER